MSSLIKILKDEISELESEIKTDNYLDLYFMDKDSIEDKRKKIVNLNDYVESYYSIKKRTLLNQNLDINYKIENIRSKLTYKKRINFKFSKIKSFLDEENEFDCDIPNLTKFNIDFSKYNNKEFIINSFYLSVLFKILFQKTEEYLYKRISISLSETLKHMRINQEDIDSLMINDSNVNILVSELWSLINNDRNTNVADIIRTIKEMINLYSDEKKGKKKESNLGTFLDMIVNLNEENKKDEESIHFKSTYVKKPFLKRTTLKLLKMNSDMFKFLVNIGFDDEYFGF